MSTANAPGRPRDKTIDERILKATISLLAGDGYSGTTIEAVAAASGVSRPAIYRRFRNRTDLIVHAARYVFTALEPPVPTASDPRDFVVTLLENTTELLRETPAGAVFRNLIPYLDQEPRLAAAANGIGARRRARLKEAVEQAISTGDMRARPDLDVWLDGVLGAIYFRFLITGRTLDREYIERLLT